MKRKIIYSVFGVLFIISGSTSSIKYMDASYFLIGLAIGAGLIYWGFREKHNSTPPAEKPAQSHDHTVYSTRASTSDPLQSVPLWDIQLSDEKLKRNFFKYMPEIKLTNVTAKTDTYYVSKFVTVDVETTGLKPATDRIVSVSAIRFEDWEPVERFYTLINPEKPISGDATKVNHITDDMVADAPTFAQVAMSLKNFVGNSSIVGHNVRFDLSFLYCSGLDLLDGKRKYYDTLQLARYLFENTPWMQTDNYKLATVCKHYRIKIHKLHDAGYDSYATGLLFKAIVKDKTKRRNL